MTKLMILAGIFTAIAYQPAHAQLYDYASEQAYGRRVEHGAAYRQDGGAVRYRSAGEGRYVRIPPAQREEYGYAIRQRETAAGQPLITAQPAITAQPVNTLRPYLGVDAGTTDIGYSGSEEKYFLKDRAMFVGGAAGLRIGRNWGVEVFYQTSNTAKKTADDEWRTEGDYTAYGVDALGFLPLNDQLELVAAAGVGKYEFDVKLKYSDGIHEFSGSDDNVGYRFGAGAQYNITGHWALRGMVRYVVLDSEYIDDMLEFSLGMRYTF